MQIPKHWASAFGTADEPQGKRFAFRIWGWSEESVTAAASMARQRLAETCARVARGAFGSEAYFYGKAPLREEIVRSVGAASAEPFALVTRNRYGALVLNAARVPFIDVDTPAAGASFGLLALFGGRKADPALDRVRAACGRFPRTSFRIYRTAAGLRLLATDLLLDPQSPQAQELLAAFEADPFFTKLCRLQASFRARLTPKPWRCGCRLPPGSHPRESPATQLAYTRWLQEYEAAIRSKATCALIETQGPGRTLPEVLPIVEEHDRACRVGEKLPLA